MAGDETKNFYKDAGRLAEDIEHSRANLPALEQTYDEWLEDQGVETGHWSFQDLEDSLQEHGVISDDENEVTAGWGRQLHAPGRIETQVFEEVARNPVADALAEKGLDTRVVPFTLTSDPFVHHNTEKRSYVWPSVATQDGITQVGLAQAENSMMLEEHPVDVSAEDAEIIERELGANPDNYDRLHELQAAMGPDTLASEPDEVPDFQGVYQDALHGLVRSDVFPEHVLVDTSYEAESSLESMPEGIPEGRALKLEHDTGPWYEGSFDGEEITVSVDSALEEGKSWLPAMEGYNFVLLPATAHPNMAYVLRDGIPANGKFAPETALDLEDRLDEEVGIETFTVADIGEPSMRDGEVVAPDAAVEELLDQKTAKRVEGEGHYAFDTALMSLYTPGSPSGEVAVDDAMDMEEYATRMAEMSYEEAVAAADRELR